MAIATTNMPAATSPSTGDPASVAARIVSADSRATTFRTRSIVLPDWKPSLMVVITDVIFWCSYFFAGGRISPYIEHVLLHLIL